MANKWILHIKKIMKTMKAKGTYKKGLGLKQVIREAQKTWRKHTGGNRDGPAPSSASDAAPLDEEVTGAVSADAAPGAPAPGGRRRRKTHRRSRR